MTLTVGARLGPYEIHSPLGAGGMSACGYAEARPYVAALRHQRQLALGVGPQRQWKKEDARARAAY